MDRRRPGIAMNKVLLAIAAFALVRRGAVVRRAGDNKDELIGSWKVLSLEASDWR